MFKMTLVTPEKKIATDVEVEEVIVPAYRGQLNILPKHAPLMTTLSTGVLKYKETGEPEFKVVAISWGYCQVNPNGVSILAETAEGPDDVDKARSEATLRKAEEVLAQGGLSPEEIQKLQNKAKRARTRLEILK